MVLMSSLQADFTVFGTELNIYLSQMYMCYQVL